MRPMILPVCRPRAVPLDPTLDYPTRATPAEAEWFEIAEGIFWLRFPLPFALNHVHAWLLRDGDGRGDGWCLVDCGIGGNRMRELWQRVIDTKLAGRPITRLIATHYHPDHVGSAAALHEMQQPLLLMHETEWLYARMFSLDQTRTNSKAVADYYQLVDLPSDLRDKLLARRSSYADSVPVPPPRLQPLIAGDTLMIDGTPWHVLVGSGHSPAMLSLWCPSRKIYIASDQVLPNISPNVSVWSYNPYDDALKSFMTSLRESAALDPAGDVLVLPSHGLPFKGLAKRCHTLLAHHEERLQAVMTACQNGQSAYALMRCLFPQELDEHQTIFALGETVAHINNLVEQGRLHRTTTPTGAWELLAA
jgi:glyoxylase-like metal-dependent hydrolase (beta-lactamase superfamily II)